MSQRAESFEGYPRNLGALDCLLTEVVHDVRQVGRLGGQLLADPTSDAWRAIVAIRHRHELRLSGLPQALASPDPRGLLAIAASAFAVISAGVAPAWIGYARCTSELTGRGFPGFATQHEGSEVDKRRRDCAGPLSRLRPADSEHLPHALQAVWRLRDLAEENGGVSDPSGVDAGILSGRRAGSAFAAGLTREVAVACAVPAFTELGRRGVPVLATMAHAILWAQGSLPPAIDAYLTDLVNGATVCRGLRTALYAQRGARGFPSGGAHLDPARAPGVGKECGN